MGIDMDKAMEIKQQLGEGARDSTRYKPVSLSQVLRERFQVAADEHMEGDFSHMLEMVLRLYLADPANYPLCWTRKSEGPAKNKPVTLSDYVIEEIQGQADQATDGVFARMVQAIIRGFLADQGRLQ
jgi:hypothetical protein